jgi:hypothetical protein
VKISVQNKLREDIFILAHSFRGFSSSWQGGYRRPEELILWWAKTRERERMPSQRLFPFSPCILSISSVYGMVPPTFRIGLAYLVNPPGKKLNDLPRTVLC